MGLKAVASSPAGSSGGGTAGPTPAVSTTNAPARWADTGGRNLKDSPFWTVLDTGVSTILGTTAQSPGLHVGITGDTNARIAVGVNSADVARISFGAGGASARDTFIMRTAAATLQFGNTDAASPVAQTLAVQNVLPGTSNTAGANWTFQASRGTGTGAGGSYIFQVAAAGLTGSTQNALATVMTISSAGQVLLGDGSATAPSLAFASQPQVGFELSSSTSVDLAVAGTGRVRLASTSIRIFDAAASILLGSSSDVIWSRKAAANSRFGAADAAAPVAQVTSVQGVVAGTTDTAGASWTIQGSQSTGTGSGGTIIFQTSPAAGSTGSAQNAFTTKLRIGSTNVTVAAGTATPASGSTAAALLFGTTAGFGIYYGTGAPSSLTAGQGSLYLNASGSGIADRLYVNTTGSTTWTNFVSAA